MAGEYPRAGLDYPRNWHELLEWFPDDGACLRYLERLRWGNGFSCRFCGAVDSGWWQMADGLRRCAACRSETSVTAGTIVAGTRSPKGRCGRLRGSGAPPPARDRTRVRVPTLAAGSHEVTVECVPSPELRL